LGKDAHKGKDFSHRCDWIRGRVFELQAIFAIEIYAYAVMSNHVDLLVYVQRDVARAWDDRDVAERWLKLLGGKPLIHSSVRGEKLSEPQAGAISSWIGRYLERRFSISWFMRSLNEPIARAANAEADVTGRFWEGRFKSLALLDEASVNAAMAYVDLNPRPLRNRTSTRSSSVCSSRTRNLSLGTSQQSKTCRRTCALSSAA